MQHGPYLGQSSGYFMEEVDGEFLLYRPTAHKAFHLDRVASVIWQLCDGTRRAGDIVREIAQCYPESDESVEQDVKSTLERLESEGALLSIMSPPS